MPAKLHVIPGTPAPDTPAERVRERVRRSPRPPAMLQCHRCGGRELVQARIGVLLKNGKPTGGTAQLLCVLCLTKGERVTVP